MSNSSKKFIDFTFGICLALQIDPYELFTAFFGGSDKLFGDSLGSGGFHYSAETKGNRALNIR